MCSSLKRGPKGKMDQRGWSECSRLPCPQWGFWIECVVSPSMGYALFLDVNKVTESHRQRKASIVQATLPLHLLDCFLWKPLHTGAESPSTNKSWHQSLCFKKTWYGWVVAMKMLQVTCWWYFLEVCYSALHSLLKTLCFSCSASASLPHLYISGLLSRLLKFLCT